MIKNKIITLLLFFLPLGIAAQNKNNIPLVELVDRELISEIKKMIHEQVSVQADSTNGYFTDGRGYITLKIAEYYNSDTLNRYIIRPDQSAIEIGKKVHGLPEAYAFVEGRPVLIYHLNTNVIYDSGYSKKSIRRFLKMIESFLEKPEKIIGKNESGNVIIRDDNFRPPHNTYSMTKSIYTFHSKPAIVKWDGY